MGAERKLKTVPGSSVIGPAVWAKARWHVASWDYHALDPRPIQTEHLLSHCRTAKDTEFGRAHRLGEVRSYEDFRERVPVRTYADFEPMLERMRNGERDVLWPGLIQYYGCSSGSSSTVAKNKYLPVSMTQIGWQQLSGFDVCASYLVQTGQFDYTRGYTLHLMPPAVLKPEGPVFVSSNPGIMQRHMPIGGKLVQIPKPAIRDIENYDQKLWAIAEAYVDYDVRAISGTTCWFPILFDRVLAAARKRGLRADTVADVWPNLGGLFGGGVNAVPYQPIIAARMGRPITFIDNYNATEGGIFAITDRAGDDGMKIVPHRGVFYEFIPRGDLGKPNAKRFPIWQVEAGQEYAIAVTTSSGLFSYLMGDYVKFRSVFPHRLEFTGRVSGVLSVTQELTSYIEIERAVAAASTEQPCKLVDFAAGAEVGIENTAKGRYVLFVEFEEDPKDLEAFTNAFDQALSRENRVYREHRKHEVAILPPKLVPLTRGATRKFMEALGQNSIQHKFPRIVDDRRRDLIGSFGRAAMPPSSSAPAVTGAP